MGQQNTLSVLIVGDSGSLTPASPPFIPAVTIPAGIELVVVKTSAYEAAGCLPLENCTVIEGYGWSFRESLEEALRQTNGEWVVLLRPDEFLLSESLSQLLTSLQTSVHGIRHGSTSLVTKDDATTSLHHGAPECSYPLIARWWLTALHPHSSALFMRRALIHKALQITSHHHRLTRYGLALGLTRCCPSKALDLCTSGAYLDRGNHIDTEQESVSIIRQEITVHSAPEQAALWRDYYISRLTEAPLHKLPALLPHSKPQAQALASLLAESNAPMAQILWNIYQDIRLSKQAVIYLSKWSSITETGATVANASQNHAPLKERLCEEFQSTRGGVRNILLLSENLSGSPLATVAQLLREQGKNGATLYTVSYNEDEYQNIFADLASRGLLGWIRPAIAKKMRPRLENGQLPSESFINQFNISHRMPQRSLAPVLEDTQGAVEYVIAHIDDPFICAELAHLAEHVTSSHTIVIQGHLAASKIGAIEESIRRHRPLESMSSHGEITVIKCGEFPTS